MIVGVKDHPHYPDDEVIHTSKVLSIDWVEGVIITTSTYYKIDLDVITIQELIAIQNDIIRINTNNNLIPELRFTKGGDLYKS